MAANPTAAAKAANTRNFRTLLSGGAGALVLGFVAFLVLVPSSGPEGTTYVEQGAQFDTAGAEALVTELAKAHQAQGVCYGYELSFNTLKKQVGSNLGVDKPVRDPKACPKWVLLSVDVDWTSESSESEDSGYYSLTGSAGLSLPTRTELEQAGLTNTAIIDAPAEATAAAVLGLPLLMTTHGQAAVPEGPASTESPEPLTRAGSDFLRENSGLLVAAVALLGAALGIGLYGLFGYTLPERRRRAAESARMADKLARALAKRTADDARAAGRQPRGPSGPRVGDSGPRPGVHPAPGTGPAPDGTAPGTAPAPDPGGTPPGPTPTDPAGNQPTP
ncbi:hypothetical protein AB0M43_19515 [Longispora sp. NPDC051575]|uniref:hypothetical protein n=1 Tax=Longispora sp. NPDC051575 TaxID=3154943 RepID=UPI003433790E